MHEAVASGRRELVKWLLDGRPSQVNATNHEGRTPLHIAAATDNADLCRLLLDRGAEINPVARSSKNEPLTPLDCATSRGHRSTAKYLQMHGGLPASKLSNTQIILDGAQITGLPTRKVTSTKIDVRDRIRIEKREVVELSSPAMDKRKTIDDHDFESKSSSSSEDKRNSRKAQKKYSDRYSEKRKKVVEKQKSFSDGYDSEFEGYEKYKERKQKVKKESRAKKNRSKSEPSRRSKSSPRYHSRYTRSTSESSSETSSCAKRRKSKRHRKRSKRKNTSTSSSSSELSERHSTKQRGKKTSIHIENDDIKQKVNITKYKNIEQPQGTEVEEKETITTKKQPLVASTDGEPVKEPQMVKTKTHSETETDTLSVKTNMVITEAQIHMERESTQHGSSELTVTVDSSNNVSIETANLSVTHKDINEEIKEVDKTQIPQIDRENVTSLSKEDSEMKSEELKSDTITENVLEAESKELIDKESLDDKSKEIKDISETKLETSFNQEVDSEQSKDLEKESESVDKRIDEKASTSGSEEKKDKESSRSGSSETRKTSFQVLSGPDETDKEKKDETLLDMNKEKGVSLDKGSPSVSFSNKDEVFKIKDSENESEQVLGDNNETGMDIEKVESKVILDNEIIQAKEKEIETPSTNGENGLIPDKGIITIFDDTSFKDRGLQEVISQDEEKEYDTDLPMTQISPSRASKFSKDSQVSSRKSSIYETESYKVLSDTIDTADLSPGILKKSRSLIDEEHMNEERLRKDSSFGRIPSISDNEIYYSHSEANGRRKRFRKKGRMKSRLTLRSKSENSERGYESSGLLDSGFEPSPRPVQRCIMSPRLNAYYQQRKSARNNGKTDSKIPVRKPGDKKAVDMRSVTQRIQTNMRRFVLCDIHYCI